MKEDGRDLPRKRFLGSPTRVDIERFPLKAPRQRNPAVLLFHGENNGGFSDTPIIRSFQQTTSLHVSLDCLANAAGNWHKGSIDRPALFCLSMHP